MRDPLDLVVTALIVAWVIAAAIGLFFLWRYYADMYSGRD